MLLSLTYWQGDVTATVDLVEYPRRLAVRLLDGGHLNGLPRLEHIFDKRLTCEADGQAKKVTYPRLPWPRTYQVVWPDGRKGRIAIFDHGRLHAWDGRRRLLDPEGVRIHEFVAPTVWERLAAP